MSATQPHPQTANGSTRHAERRTPNVSNSQFAGGSVVGDFDVPVEHPMTPEEVAALLQIDRETVYRMARRGQLPAFKVSSRWRFLPSHLQRWMEGEEGRAR
jgi:excisionase family DNA binding protein